MSALEEILDTFRHDEGCSAEIDSAYRCRCRRDEYRDEARAELTVLRAALAEAQERVARMQAGPWRAREDLMGRANCASETAGGGDAEEAIRQDVNEELAAIDAALAPRKETDTVDLVLWAGVGQKKPEPPR
jgi:hypothetical protein